MSYSAAKFLPPSALQLSPGDPSELGARFDGQGVLFSVFSENAEMLELCLFDESDKESRRYSFSEAEDGVWHGYLPGVAPGLRYGFRAHGAFKPEEGHYFNPNRLLLDPYAREISGRYQVSAANTVCRFDDQCSDSENPVPAFSFAEDNAWFVPRSVVRGSFGSKSRTREAAVGLQRKSSDRVIYEAHVAGLTALRTALPVELRGKFAGAGSVEIISHLRSLGVTSLQLLPVQFFVDEPHLIPGGLSNYWGYNTLNFFTPQSSYASRSELAVQEMKQLVRRLHDANIEVLLDVVYNHTAEGGADGPTLCYRGLDNASYYRLDANNANRYINDTGCGNTLDTNKSVVQDLILDSLRYWTEEFGVDGFRFDLAVSLGREPEGFSPKHKLFERMQSDPVLSRSTLIAEPWDIGPGGYQTGGFAGPWLEWNDRFRDAARSYWRGDSGAQAELGKRLHGSSDLFESSGRDSGASVNFITSHDGFTLADLVSYENKHNEGNLEDNRDGHGHNLSGNLGVEGSTNDPDIRAARDKRSRALLATLVLAQGTPMLLGGDELKNSQAGNNNAYCQNNATGWVQWDALNTSHVSFFSRLTDLRAQLSIFGSQGFVHEDWVGEPVGSGKQQIAWRRFDGLPMRDDDWHLSSEDGASPFAVLWATETEIVLFALNPCAHASTLILPEGFDWQCRLDTSVPRFDSELALLDDGSPDDAPTGCSGTRTTVPSQAFCVFSAAELTA